MRKLASTPTASVICFLIALAARFAMMRAFLGISSDKFALVLTTRNFLEGHGLSVGQVVMDDLSQKFYVPFIGWPPGYNLLLAPFMAIFKNDFMWATFLLDGCIAVLFFIYLRKLLLLIHFPVWVTNLFLVLQGFLIHPYITHSNPTDFIALFFLLAGIYHIIRLLMDTRFSLKQSLFIIFFLSGTALTRYQYMPVAFILPALLLFSGFIQKKRSWKIAGTLLFFSQLAIIGSVLIYQKVNAGSFVYQYSSEPGFCPENLLLMYPVVAASLFNVDFYSMQLSLLFKSDYTTWAWLIYWLNMLSFIALAILFTIWITRKKFKPSSATEHFIFYSTVAALTSVAVLFYMSISTKATIIPPLTGWTYVLEPRYYSFPALLVQLFTWWWLFCGKGFTILRKYLRWVFMFVVAVEILHGAYILKKKYAEPMVPVKETYWSSPEIAFTRQFIIEQSKKGDRQVVVTSLIKQFGFLADWFDAACMLHTAELNIRKLLSSRPVILLVVIHDKELPWFTHFLKNKELTLVKKVAGFNFYTLYVQPG